MGCSDCLRRLVNGEDLHSLALQRRPLLVVTGQSQPSRRFLRALARSAPEAARRLVVATGDAIAFNTIYRDRQVAWPIQELPFALVFFNFFISLKGSHTLDLVQNCL